MSILNNEENYEAYLELLEGKLNRALSVKEQDRVKWLASSDAENFHIYKNLFEELGSERADNW